MGTVMLSPASSRFLMFQEPRRSLLPKSSSSDPTCPQLLSSQELRPMLQLRQLSSNSRPGFNAHAAAEAAVLFAQGRAPANLSPGELAHYQAEQAVLSAQQNLLVQG